MFEMVGEAPTAFAPALADLDPSAVTDAELIDAMVAAEQLASFAAARQAELVAELAARRMSGSSDGGEFVLGVSDEPGELAGHGPIPAGLARMLAAGGIWRRLLTNPRSGALLELGRTTYAPPAALADHVRARDATCRFPGCRRPAVGCDLDHTRRYPNGPTSPCNLAALCRHHHRLKHLTDWTVNQDQHGTLTWTSPTGHTYRTHPPPHTQPEQRQPEQSAPAKQPEPAEQPVTEQPEPAEIFAPAKESEWPGQPEPTEQPAVEQPTRADHDTAA